MAAKKVKTKKPNGGSISRSGYGFTLSWKITDKDYGDGQSCQYRVKVNSTWGKWVNISLSRPKTDTKASITLTASSYYPQKAGAYLKAVEFRARGNRKK